MGSHFERLAQQKARELAGALRQAAREDLAARVFRREAIRVLARTAQAFGVTLVQQGAFWVARGRDDALCTLLTFDFLSPGLIGATERAGSSLDVISAVKRHAFDAAQRTRGTRPRPAGVATDGRYFIIVRRTGGAWLVESPTPVDPESTERVLRLIHAVSSGAALIPENLTKDFGPRAPRARRAILALHTALVGASRASVHARIEQWRGLFGVATDYRVWTEKLATRKSFKRFVQNLGVEAGTASAAEILFVLHTYYAMLIKLVASLAAAHFAGGGANPLSRLGEASGDELRDAFVDLERGTPFQACGIRNFVEGDLFGWYLSAWSHEIAESVRAMARRLAEYDPGTLELAPESTRDLLKDLYLHLVPRVIRHDLGEYYTPDWLAEHLLVQTMGDEDLGDPDKRVLDPACGSGTFLVIVIRHIVQRMRMRHVPAHDVLARVLQHVIGVDLNPLAVMAARTNYLLALGDLLGVREGDVEIPVYLADSVLGSAGPFPDAGEDQIHFAGQGDGDLVPPCSAEYPSPKRVVEPERATTPARLRIEPCHYVVGNPPWINWESLPEAYRGRTRPLWVHYGLFPHGGMDTILGKGKKDIATLMTYVVVDTYLLNGGRLGFVLPQNLFKTGGGKGFRRFVLPDGTPFGPIGVEDMVDIRPFGQANNRTALAVFEKGRPVQYPVPYTLWTHHAERPVEAAVFDSSSRLASRLREKSLGAKASRLRMIEESKDCEGGTPSLPAKERLMPQSARGRRITPRRWYAEPVEKQDSTAPWITARGAALQALHNVLGISPYRAHEGANTGGANGIYWVEVLEKVGDLAVVRNITAGSRRKVPQVRATIETEILYPLLRGRDVGRWRASPSAQIIMAQDPATRRGIGRRVMSERFPRALAYLSTYETVLRGRAAFRRYFHDTAPCWSMFNVSAFTFSPWKVVWREQAKRFTAAVVGPTEGRPVIPDHKLMMVAVESPEEAYYLCAALNSAPATLAVAAYTIPIQMNTHVLKHVAVPRFSADDPRHREMARLAEAAQRAAIQGANAALQRLEEDIDRCAAALWRLTDLERLEIKRSLEDS